MAATPSPPVFLNRVYGLAGNLDTQSFYTGDGQTRRSSLVSPDAGRPYVTLTFAQSLDAKIAGTGGQQLALSGKESMLMTHWMRTLHDGILVGIGTAINDNPQLNIDFPHRYHLPRPIILDTHLRLPIDCKLFNNYKAGVGRRPWVIASASSVDGDESRASRKSSLEAAGARIVEVSFLGAEVRHRNCIDTVIVTVAPNLVGKDGIGYGSNLPSDTLPAMRHVETVLFGIDAVVALRMH
ncbi:dihydrofolate reductase-like domain-containing protein [Fomitopsis serialis]|uniref:dihydrofolate reductase-like domain-containing protein n=1 Tax=Fomitopsis serialis TaxID=139415 RepID=UPI002007DDD3|nr:dihydrofolate reductase-like domain-containing protein [Neoantrodia serialis]KAH9929677.1 dihydrofolate reductase-like domain-containing protein [Neoantrodia serialis]